MLTYILPRPAPAIMEESPKCPTKAKVMASVKTKDPYVTKIGAAITKALILN